jgi:hypothetical protein
MSDDRTFMDKVLGREEDARGTDTRERTADEFPTPREHRDHLPAEETHRSPDDGWLEPTTERPEEARRGPTPTAADVDPAPRSTAPAASVDGAPSERAATSERAAAPEHRAAPEHGTGPARDHAPDSARPDTRPSGSYADRLGDRDPHAGEEPVALVPTDRAEDYRRSWEGLKASFVDEPRGAVRDANELVGHVLDDVAELFATQRAELEKDLRNEQADTEQLRQALNRYRAFFDRLLTL